LKIVQNILPKGISCSYVHQSSHLGLGHAVLCAKELVGNEPFAILLADDLIDVREKTCLQQMLDVFKDKQSSIVAIQKVPHTDTDKYGIVDVVPGEEKIAEIRGIVEKPESVNAPSDLGVVGRYILTPEIFRYLEKTEKGSGGEIQLTDAIAKLLLEQSVYGLQFEGDRYDCGSKLEYLEASVVFALKQPELAHHFKKWLHDFVNMN
jgi:UTP--glucose-1-phosphate uridylyltransferase